ncbi:hypothetical protein INT45_001707 [Circinella minor]|uniref:Uncharacterized protein n=1 Tax=Circinella minor TaxID=1195481 RepID=A0A8H7VEI4_9FUNG|nr:hypothetical protein INT45_001707 [Circinella minor]
MMILTLTKNFLGLMNIKLIMTKKTVMKVVLNGVESNEANGDESDEENDGGSKEEEDDDANEENGSGRRIDDKNI